MIDLYTLPTPSATKSIMLESAAFHGGGHRRTPYR
jgi:hypothetical protein